MAKMISANKLNRFWKNGVLARMIAKTKVLKTMEEISANTNAENVVGATVAAEIIDNLTFPDGKKIYPDIKDGERGYNTDPARGADTFIPFRGMKSSNILKIINALNNASSYTREINISGVTGVSNRIQGDSVNGITVNGTAVLTDNPVLFFFKNEDDGLIYVLDNISLAGTATCKYYGHMSMYCDIYDQDGNKLYSSSQDIACCGDAWGVGDGTKNYGCNYNALKAKIDIENTKITTITLRFKWCTNKSGGNNNLISSTSPNIKCNYLVLDI